MNDTDFEHFIKLVELDQQYHQLLIEKSTLLSEMEQLEQDIDFLHNKLEEAHQVVVNLRKKINIAELDLKSLDLKEQEKKKQIDNVLTTKEYYSFEKELSDLKVKKSDLESEILFFMQQLENAELEYEKIEKEVPSKIQETETNIKNLQRRINYIDIQINELSKQRPIAEKKIPSDYLELYSSMRGSVINPVVPAKNNNCSACSISITMQDLQNIRQHKLVKCRNCFRLLYISPTENPIKTN